MAFEEIIKALLVVVLIILPALAVTLGLTARFAARPIVDALVRLRELGAPAPPSALEARVGAVEEEMRSVRELVERVVAAVEFDAQLRAGGGAGVSRLPQA